MKRVILRNQWKKTFLCGLIIGLFVLLALEHVPTASARLSIPLKTAAINQQLQKGEFPELSVVKHVDKNQTKLGGSFTITIRIVNYSNKTAFNVSVTEPMFPSWAFDMIGSSEYHYDRIEPGVEQLITYVLISKTSGNFTLEPTVVTYVDTRDVTVQHTFTAVSNIVDLTVLPKGPNIPGKFQALFESVMLFLLIFVGIGVVRLIFLKRSVGAGVS